jgi:hypothetical protein
MVQCVMRCLRQVVSIVVLIWLVEAVTENLNVLDYETYITITDLILENKIPLLLAFNDIYLKFDSSFCFWTCIISEIS